MKMGKYNLSQLTKTLDKLFSAGFKDEKSILALKLEDLEKIQDFGMVDVNIIINLKKAIKTKQLIKFLSEGEV